MGASLATMPMNGVPVPRPSSARSSPRRAPDAVRPFRAPAAWLVGLGAAFGCLYLFISLPHQTQLLFGAWNIIGLALYFGWARRNVDKEAA